MRVAPALIALFTALSVARAAPEAKTRVYRAVVYFKGSGKDATGPYSEVVLKPRSDAASSVRLRGKALDPKLEKTYVDLEFETATDCSFGCDAKLRAFHDVVNPVDVRDHPLRGSPKRLRDSTN